MSQECLMSGCQRKFSMENRSAGYPVFRYTSVTHDTPLQLSIRSIQTNDEPLTVFVSGL